MEYSMKRYRIETTVSDDGTLTLEELPFRAGDKVEVIVQSCEAKQSPSQRYPLRGQPIRYGGPFESVAENEWDALK
jgi:hypothetical protein